MEKFDPSMESRVWQRVTGSAGVRRQDLGQLLLAAREAAGDYRYLAAHMTGDQAKKLHERAQDTVERLQGLQRLSGGEPRKPPALPQNQTSVRRVLEQSYHRSRRLAAEFTARSADPEWGMVFAGLAQREQENAMRIAGLMGAER